MKKKVLITGGTGYIGSHTAVEFINSGYEVVIVDNLSNSDLNVLEGIEKITGTKPVFYKLDLTKDEEVEEFFEIEKGFDVIIHFAAFKAVGESVEKPLKYYKNNLFSLINLLVEANKHNINNIIFSSSCAVYGDTSDLPVTERHPVLKTTSPYGNTKKIAEEILQDNIKVNKKMQVIALRYFNPIGSHPSLHIGEKPVVTNNILPLITQTVAGLRGQLKVFGNDYDTPDGTPVRDYIHVVDVAKAHLVAAERLLKNKNKSAFEAFNLGIGRGISVLELIKMFEEVTGQKVDYKITGRREGDVAEIWADPTLANTELGWKAELSIKEALQSAWEWQKILLNK